MWLDIAEIRESERPFAVRAHLGDSDLQVEGDLVRLVSPVDVEAMVTVRNDLVEIRGRLRTDLEVTCCRCLERVSRAIEKEFRLDYQKDPEVAQEGEEIVLSYSDLEVGFYRDDRIDLSAVVTEQILFDVPMKPLCRPDCRGLCDQCGANLNLGECGCDRTPVDPRLAGLKDLKNKWKH